MRATINGQERTFENTMTIAELLELLETPSNGIAVARNDAVVSKARHATERIEDGDRIEIIKAVAGG